MLDVVDPATVPELQGILAPVLDEVDAGPLEVVSGRIPADLVGTYLRNGPNPRFTPLGAYTYPLDGDGMVHGLWFDGESVRYRNRFVRTPALDCEERAGKALWPGVMTGAQPTADEVGPELAGTDRDLVDIHVIRHAGRILALAEGERCFEISGDLSTVGPYDFGGRLPRLCAHPKVDPATGDLVVFRYGILSEPWLTWAVVGADGTVTTPETVIDLDGSYMIHDCAITDRHLLLFVSPLRFDIEAAFRGEPLLSWRPQLGTRIAVVDRVDGTVRWFDADTFWVWHIANAWQQADGTGTTIVVDLPTWSHPGMGLVAEPSTAKIVRCTLDLDRGTSVFADRFHGAAEFPRIDDRRVGLPNRWFHVAGKDPDAPTTHAGEWNRLLRFDTTTGSVQDRRGGRTCFGEAVFAPRAGATAEDDGYLLTYAYDLDTLGTTLLVLDAADIEAEPACVLELPQRVPFGLHGSWLPER